MARGQARHRDTGQFSYQGKWNRLCVCGHELGFHAAEAPHDCFNADRLNIGDAGDMDPNRFPPTDCKCQKFRPSRKKVA